MYQAYRVTAMLSNEWKLPLNVAVGIHVLILLGALYLPGIFKAKPRFADVYTVSVINVAEPAASKPPPTKAPATTSPPVIASPKKTQKMAPIAEKIEKVLPVSVEPVAQKAISLKPLKKKIIQEPKPQETQIKKRETERKQEIERKQKLEQEQKIERKKRQRLAEAIREEELLSEKAKLAREALEDERQLLQPQSQVNTLQTTSSATSGNQTSNAASATGGSSNLLESQYLASIFNRLSQFWAPPEYLQQDPNLTTVVVITINLDGTIANMLVESKSGDRVFDQFVRTTLEAAAPMPPIPPALKKQRFELGLRFRPGSIQ